MSEVRMSVLRARVRASHTEPEDQGVDFQHPQWVEIEKCKEDGYVLIHVYEVQYCRFVHTWQPSVKEAKNEAEFEFSVDEREWETVGRENG
jgi:hypothetical protein